MTANVDPQALADSLRRMTRDVEEGQLLTSLRQVLDACVLLFDVTGSGLMVADEESALRYVVATDGPGHLLEEVQINVGSGPCVDTFVRDELTTCADLATDERWPDVAAAVVPAGVVAVLGVPIRLAGTAVGSLDVYQGSVHHWDQSEKRALTRYGEVIETLLSAALSAERAGELAAQLHYALDYRAPIERGVGYLMARDAVGQVEAFNRLRVAARSSRRKIGAVAEELLATGRLPQEAS